MNSVEEVLNDPSNDEIEPPSPKKLKLSMDVPETHFPLAQPQTSLNDPIIVADDDKIKNMEEEKPSATEANILNEDIHENETKNNVKAAVTDESNPNPYPVDTSLQEDRANEKGTKLQQNEINPVHTKLTNENQNAVNTPPRIVPSPTVSQVNQKSPAEKRRDALRGIVMGIKSPPTTLSQVIGSDHDKLANVVQESKATTLSNDDGSNSKPEELHVVKRRKPRKEPKPRLPLENRVFYSKKEVDSATLFVNDKEDLCDCLPLDDCFFLGEMFWIFTVHQLERTLEEPNLVKDMIAQFSNASTGRNSTRSIVLGDSSSQSTSPDVLAAPIFDLSTFGPAESNCDPLIDNKKDADTQDVSKSSENELLLVSQTAPVDKHTEKTNDTTTQILSTKYVPSAEASAANKDIEMSEALVTDEIQDARTAASDDIESMSKDAASQHEMKPPPLDSLKVFTSTDDDKNAEETIDTATQILPTNHVPSSEASVTNKDTEISEPLLSEGAPQIQDARTAAAYDMESASIDDAPQQETKPPPMDSLNVHTSTDNDDLRNENIPNGCVMMKERITFWREAITIFRKGRARPTQLQERFRLDGPVKLLFPPATLNFLKSIQLETLWKFLALRKSETGAICDLMHIWRNKCNMSVIPDIGLGRHFLAIAARIETILTAFPPIQESDRGWILDPISGITGAARDFLIRDHKIMSGVEFLNLKTKQLADVLETWRQSNGMEKLRGSGKVAMISAWKAYVKEAIEVENDAGIVVDLSSFVAMVQNEKHVPTTTDISGSSKHTDIVVKATANHKETSNLAMHSKMVLEQVLGDGATALLRSGGIQTASELFAVDMSADSQLYKTLIKTGIVDGMPAFIKGVQKWRESINQYLNKFASEKDLPPTKNSKQNKAPTQVLSFPEETAIGSSLPTHGLSTAKGSLRADTSTSRRLEYTYSNQAGDDPVYDTLSYTTKQFLASMRIHTAKDFLKTRSSELAVHFVPWRRSMGKPDLKGMGSIASISGWKSQVRKKAKEMGLDDLAELEPSTRGTKKAPHPQIYLQEESNNVAAFDNGGVDNDIEINTTQHGEGLSTANSELFSVQHQGIDCQSVFELSARPGKKLPQNRKLFITFKGITSQKTPKLNAEQIQLDILLQKSEPERTVYILPDVPVSTNRQCTIHENDKSRLLFSMPSSVGLIDVSLHGAYPYQDQSLDLIEMTIEKYITEGHSVKLDECEEQSQEIYNVLVRKVRLDSFQYLLYLPIPVESGHTIKVIFPSITTILCLKTYVQSDFEIMHKIDESLATLSTNDLRKLMTWLRERADALLSREQTDIEKATPDTAMVLRRRFHWLERRIIEATERQKVPKLDSSSKAECFVFQYNSHDTESTNQEMDPLNLLIDEVKIELRYALELDITCGLKVRRGWNALDIHFFDDLITCVAQCLSKSRSEDCEWSPLLDLINSTICSDATAEQCASTSIGKNGCEDHMEIDDTVATSEKKHHCAAETESPPSDISHNFIWQVVNSVFDVLRIDIYRTENASTLRTCLLSIHSILFVDDAIVNDPILCKYETKLYYASLLPRSDIDYVPNTNMLFLGLVWPILRNYGWRIAINKESNDVTYTPYSMSQNRRGAMKQLHDRLRVRTKRTFKFAGFHLIPKMAKRLLVAITNNSCDGVDTDIAYDKNYTVEAILDKFLVSLLNRFATLKDIAKFKVNEITRNVVTAMGECFDTCAPMLLPISTLSPHWKVDGASISRPITAYRCEYLIPFLFNLVSRATFQASSDVDAVVVGDAVHGLARDLLIYISEQYQEFIDQRFHPPFEEFVVNDTPALWIETHIHSLLFENDQKTRSTDISMGERDEAATNEINLMPKTESFHILLDEEKGQVTDFIRIILENTKPSFATGAEMRRKNTLPVGAPGIVCRHCSGKYGEGKYFFSSIESLSTCYPVLERHYYKCPDTPAAIKVEVTNARALHTQQRRSKPSGTQQTVFVKLWNRMARCKPGVASLQNGSANLYDSEDEAIDNSRENGTNENELVFTNHRAVIDYIRNSDSKNNHKLSKSSQEEIDDVLDTYYACIEYAGRIYGTPSMPQHFSTRWLLHKMTTLGQLPPSTDAKSNHESVRVG